MTNIINRVKGLIVSPKTEWDKIATEQSKPASLATTYALPLLLIGTVACFISFGVIGLHGFRSMNFGFRFGLMHALSIGLAMVATAFGIDMLAPNFQSQKNMVSSTQLAVYSFTPLLIVSALYIIPNDTIRILVKMAGFYGLYLMYEGFPKLKTVPEDKKMTYMFASMGIAVGSYAILDLIMYEILKPTFSDIIAAYIPG